MELLGLPVGKPRAPHAMLTDDELGVLRKTLQEQFSLTCVN